jgi:segregation and condensation protein B
MSTDFESVQESAFVAIGTIGHLADGAEYVQPGLAGAQDALELESLIEALLLVSPAPATVEELALGAGVEICEVEAALACLESRIDGGWVVQRHAGRVQLATSPRFAAQVRRFLGLDREARLSSAALEALAIIAYQQPVTRPEVEIVRGVDCSGVLQTLMQRGLIEQVGRLTGPGNAIQYGTTPEFLQHFGLRSLAELPPLGQAQGQDIRGALEAAVASAQMEPVAAAM